jgi:hypothetical protein
MDGMGRSCNGTDSDGCRIPSKADPFCWQQLQPFIRKPSARLQCEAWITKNLVLGLAMSQHAALIGKRHKCYQPQAVNNVAVLEGE